MLAVLSRETIDSAIGRVDGVGFLVTPFVRSAALSDELGFGAGRRGVGEGRDAQRRREPQGPPPDVDPAAPPRCGIARSARRASAARDRLLWQRRARRGDAGGRGATGRSTCSSPSGWMTESVSASAPWARRSTAVNGWGPIRPVTRRCSGSARPSTPGRSRSPCRAPRTRCASTVAGRSRGRCSTSAPRSAIELDRVFVQVGGGAFATCVGDGLGAVGVGCTTACRAGRWLRPARGVDGARAGDVRPARASTGADVMTVWDDPHSLADGILDDETYDWIGVVEGMRRSGGEPVVAPEAQIIRAHSMAVDAGFDVSATGSAGLAGLLGDPRSSRRRRAGGGRDEWRRSLTVGSIYPQPMPAVSELS